MAPKAEDAEKVQAAKSEKAAFLEKLLQVRAENARKDVQIAELQAELIDGQQVCVPTNDVLGCGACAAGFSTPWGRTS